MGDVKEASSTAVDLLGNANTRISGLRRDKLVSSINKSLTPLVQDDTPHPLIYLDLTSRNGLKSI